MDISYVPNISIEDYKMLRRSAHFDINSDQRIEAALRNSLYKVAVTHDDKVIAMARVIGDGGCVYFISDVIVHPDYQGKGIGKRLINHMLDWIDSQVLEGETIMVNLMSAYDKEPFYEKLGFSRRPFGKHGCGMSKWIRK